MVKQVINVGTTANDRSGDPLRIAFDKINGNFTELYASGGGGSGTQGIQGIQGIAGTIGIQGIQGISGNEGLQGIQGIQGIAGNDGLPGTNVDLIAITGAQVGNSVTFNTDVNSATPDITNASSIDNLSIATLLANDWIGSNAMDPQTYPTIRFANGDTYQITGWNTDSGFISLNSTISYLGFDVWPFTITSYNYVAGTVPGKGIIINNNVWKFDDNGVLTLPSDIQSIGYNNLVLRSKDNINLYAGEVPGDDSEGGDINIYAGKGDPDNGGGDVQIRGGEGGDLLGLFDTGNAGGYVQLRGGYSRGTSDGGYVELTAGPSERGRGGNIRINAGYGSDNILKLDNVTITDIILDTPVRVTLAVDHNLNDGDAINFADILTTIQLNNIKYYVLVVDNNNINLFQDRALTVPVSGTGMTAYSTPGIATETATSVNAQNNNYFSQYIANAPTIGNVQVGWTATGPGLNGTKTVIAIDPVDPVVITVDGSDGSVFIEGQSYTFAEPSITGLGTAYSSSHGGDITLQPGSTYNSAWGDIGRTLIRGETQIGNDGGNIWKFDVSGTLTLPSGSPILFGNGNSRIQAGMGFHINSEEGISLEAVNTTDPLNPVTKNWTFGSTGQMTFPQGTVLAELVSGPTNAFGIFANGVPGRTAFIRTQPLSAGFNYDWEFGNNGILTLPNTGKVAVTGITATDIANYETAYNDSQFMYFDAVFQWTRIDNSFSPIWFNLPGRLAYDQIIAWTPPAGFTPVPANIVVLANNCKTNYAVWQEAIANSKLTIKSDTVNWEFDSIGKLTLPQGGIIAGGEDAAIQAAYTAWQDEEAGWQTVITTGGADLNIRPWNFTGPSPEEKLATVTAMWMEQQRPGAILDWVPISAAHYNEARGWLSITSNTDGYRLWKKLTTGVTITSDGKSWAFTNDGAITLPNSSAIRVDGNNLEIGGMTNFNVEASGVVNIYTDTEGTTPFQWQFGVDGRLTLPLGSVINETASTISIAPPTAAAGQSLVIRPTAALWSVDSSGFISYGNPITISVTLSSFPYFGTINYEITGPGVTEQSLGRPTTGKLTFAGISSIDTQTVTWTIPANSDINEFTFTVTSVDGTRSTDIQIENDPALYYSFEFNALPVGYFVTVTNDNITNLEFSHVHLVSGDPATVDLYLGDDDQFVKIEKNGGNVVVGTNANTKNWTFAQNGSLTLPNAGIVRTGNDTPQVGYTRTIATDSNEGTGIGTPNVVDVAYDNTIIPTYYYSGGGNPVFTDSTITFANGDVRTIISIVATGGYIDIAYDGPATSSSPEFPITLKTGNYAAATAAPEWTFGPEGSTVFPNAKVKGYCFTTTNSITNYIPQQSQFMYTDSEILQLVQAGWYIKGPGLLGWKQITSVQDNNNVALIVRIGSGNTPLGDGSEFPAGGGNVYTISQYLELDVQVADKTWIFSENGNLTFPDATTQTTAWTGVASEGTTSTTSANVGYIGMPQNTTSTSYTLVAGDQGKHIYVTNAGQTITVPANTTTTFPIGTTIAIIAGPTANPVTIAITSDTMYLGGVGSTGTRTLAAYGMATLVKVDTTTWFINGSGLS